jgi:zinc D-Ala-D-Ala carboxypeptidase
MNLSKNFTLEEMIASDKAWVRDITEQWNPPREVINNLETLCINLLQPLRDALGAIHVSSGWRCQRLNQSVGGVPDSQHLTGEAVDAEFYGPGGNQAIIDKVKELNLPFDQMIDEKNLAWVHLSYSKRAGNRRQVLKI